MYRRRDGQMTVEDFILPFSGELRQDNRWVKLAGIVPWEAFEEKYASLFGEVGNPAKPARMALGALLIQAKLKTTDEETVLQISENVYLQYFIGQKEYQTKPPFDPSMMVFFRKRITTSMLEWINEEIRKKQDSLSSETPQAPPGGGAGSTNADVDTSAANRGQLILDATCAPQDIRYPTDIQLLNEARELLEGMIDQLWEQANAGGKKPRTYRKMARWDFLRFIKRRKPSKQKIRSAIRAQLGYVRRDLQIVDQLLMELGIDSLTDAQVEKLITIHRLYDQQQQMYATKTHHAADRIVSISQPYVRPIVRGKAGQETEFGAKILVSMVNGHATIERLSWDNFNESVDLKESIEAYRVRYGFYPAVVLADKLFRNRANLAFCKKHGIRLSGLPLGRPKISDAPIVKRTELDDNARRNAIEGKFGQGKRRYGLARIMTKLKHTSEVSIHMQFLVMNLEHCLRALFSFFTEGSVLGGILQFPTSHIACFFFS